MKRIFKLILFLTAVMVIVPIVCLFIFYKPAKEEPVILKETETITQIYTVPEGISIRDGETVYTSSVREYVIGAVMAVMPVSYHEEALKAQAAAIHTRIIRETVKNADRDYDIDSGFCSFFTVAQGRAFYSDGYNEAYEKIAAAVDAVLPFLIMYESEPIAALSFPCSAGCTEETDIPYLKSVISNDFSSPDYQTTVTFTEAEMRARLITEADTPLGEIEIISRSEAKAVGEIKTGGSTLDGEQFCDILNLPSRAFYISESDGLYTITTLGRGNFYGMSRYGADVMAREGSSWQEIIHYYYTDITIKKIVPL
jgi:stage II sporulation protein D